MTDMQRFESALHRWSPKAELSAYEPSLPFLIELSLSDGTLTELSAAHCLKQLNRRLDRFEAISSAQKHSTIEQLEATAPVIFTEPLSFDERRPVQHLGELSTASIISILSAIETRRSLFISHPKQPQQLRQELKKLLHSSEEKLKNFHQSLTGSAESERERIAIVLATSGSSGFPKLVALSHRALLASRVASDFINPIDATDRFLMTLPIAHIGGFSQLTRAIAKGASLILPSAMPRSAADWQLCFDIAKPTQLSLVPTQLYRLLRDGVKAPSELRAVLLGGAPASSELLKEAAAAGWPLLPTYGMTESASQLITAQKTPSAPSSDASSQKLSTLPLLFADLRLVSALPAKSTDAAYDKSTDAAAPQKNNSDGPISEGRLKFRGPLRFSGYLPSQFPEAQELWHDSCDLAKINDDGSYQILGRADDLIISGGENISPLLIEEALAAAFKDEILCFSLPSKLWGESLLLAVQGLNPQSISSNLKQHLTKLPLYAKPKAYLFLVELPRTSSGKLSRKELRAIAQTAETANNWWSFDGESWQSCQKPA